MKTRIFFNHIGYFLLGIETMTSILHIIIGTGFSYHISDSCFSNMADNDILDKYNDTDCQVEVSGLCTKVLMEIPLLWKALAKYVLLVSRLLTWRRRL